MKFRVNTPIHEKQATEKSLGLFVSFLHDGLFPREWSDGLSGGVERLLLFRALDGLLNVRRIDCVSCFPKFCSVPGNIDFFMGVFSLALCLRIDVFGSSDGCHLCSVGSLF